MEQTSHTFAFTPASAWGRCLADFLQSIYQRSESRHTSKQYRAHLYAFLSSSAHDGPPKLPDLYTREDVEFFLHRTTHGKRKSGTLPGNATINYRLAVLSSFYTFAATYTIEGPDGRPEPLLKRPSPTIGIVRGKTSHIYKAMSFEEVKRFFDVIPRDSVRGLRDRAIFLVYFWTARRLNEIARLRWGHIERSIIVEKEGSMRVGYVYSFYGKGHSQEEDTAELPGPAKAAIDEYLEASGRMATMQADSPLFIQGVRPNGWLPDGYEKMCLAASSIHRQFKFYARAAGLDYERLSVHSFRHTAARVRYENGSDIREIQALLRHSSLQTTDLYLRKLITTADTGAKRLEAKFGGL